MMRNYPNLILLIIAAASVGCFNAEAGSRHFRNAPVLKLARERVAAPIFRPLAERQYVMDDDWVLVADLKYEYDAAGNRTLISSDEDGDLSEISMMYDEYGFETERLERSGDGEMMENVSKRTYRYDPVVHSFVTERMGYDWTGTVWAPNYYCESNSVERNKDGNVTSITKILPLEGEMVDAYRIVWGYGADGTAESYSYYFNSGGKNVTWELYDDTEYRDIVWDRTDGQLLGELLEMIEGPNRILSATAYYEGEKDGYVFASYPADGKEGFRLAYTTNDPSEVGIVQKMEILEGEQNGFIYSLEQYFDDETEEVLDYPVYIMENVYLTDEHGNPVGDMIYETYFGEPRELAAGVKYENTYNADGNLIEVVQSEYDFDSDEYVKFMRTVYDDYVDVAATSNIPASGGLRIVGGTAFAQGRITIYTADGLKVAEGEDAVSLSGFMEGLYIVASEKETLKIKL